MKPGDFLISVRDFFAVIIPGAIFLFLLSRPDRAPLFPELGPEGLFLAAVAAYLIGSAASAGGAALDLAVDGVIESSWFRKGVRSLQAREALADRLRLQLIEEARLSADHPESIKSFWWTFLRLNCPPAMAELDRLEASSKLFRSLVTVFVVYAGSYAMVGDIENVIGAEAGDFVLAAVASFIFYASGRFVFLNSVYRLGAAYALSRRGMPEN